MAANYLHGAETIEVVKGPRPVRTVKTAVIGLIGSSPIGPVNTPTVVLSDTQAAQFGPALEGFTIPQALNAIFDQGGATVIVVNVLDPATHKTTITAEAVTLVGDVATAAHPGWTANPTVTNTGATTTYVKDTDYTVDLIYGKVNRISTGAMTVGQSVKITYTYADPTKVENTDIVGEVTVGGDRTGLQGLLGTYATIGFLAKILIAPGFSTLESVSTELIAMASKLRAIALIDAPVATTYAVAIAGRGSSGAINFQTSSDRAVLCYPHLKCMDAITGLERLESYSPRLAGVIANTDNELGYWWSPSNKEIKGITGVEINLTAGVPNSEVNALNEVGITTYYSSFGTGIRTWGNRSAAWPTDTHPKNFIPIRRTADIIHESIELSMLPFLAQPITSAWLDSVMESVNKFLRTLVTRGAIIDGKCTFDPTKNLDTEIALGHVTFDVSFMPSPPAERITFESFIDISMLSQIGVGNA